MLFDSDHIQEGVFRRRTPKTVLTCPQCGSADLYYETGLITGYKYHCKKSNCLGACAIERDLEEKKKDAGN